ncbi:MAG: hydroxymethylbilane synthase [Planctomycetota bacterium]
MRRSRKPIVIASRRSELARVQAEMVARVLRRLHAGVEVTFNWVESRGDRLSGRLNEQGGKGLFTKAVEAELLTGRADVAVHSMKDLPALDTPGLTIAAVPRRADVRDALLSRSGVTEVGALPEGAMVGTASPRRLAQLRRVRDDLRFRVLRGNVPTRVAAVLDQPSNGHDPADATLLAVAGLKRLGMLDRASAVLPLEAMLPAACQGALAVQCRADDHVTVTRLLPMNHAASAAAVHAERQVVASLGASCDSALGVLVRWVEGAKVGSVDEVELWVRAMTADGSEMAEARATCSGKRLRHGVRDVVAAIESRGGRAMLEARGLADGAWAEEASVEVPVARSEV